MAMIDVIRADEMGRLSVCGDDSCGGIVLDLSRNRSRRFCSTACGNRIAGRGVPGPPELTFAAPAVQAGRLSRNA